MKKYLLMLCLIFLTTGCDNIFPTKEEALKHFDVCLDDEIPAVLCRSITRSSNCCVECYPKSEKVFKCIEAISKVSNGKKLDKVVVECKKPVIRWGQ